MSGDSKIPAVHRAIAAAAVQAILGDRAVVRQMVAVPAPSAGRAGGRAEIRDSHILAPLDGPAIERELDNR